MIIYENNLGFNLLNFCNIFLSLLHLVVFRMSSIEVKHDVLHSLFFELLAFSCFYMVKK